MSVPQGTLRKVPLFWSVGSVVLAAGAGSAAGVERRFLPGSAWLLAGGQQGWRGCCLLLGFALAPQLRSPLLPACTDEHPPYGRLSPERGRCWLTTWEASKEFRDSLKSFRDSKSLSQTCGVGDGAQPALLSVLGTHRRGISSDTEVLAVGTMGLIPCSLNRVSAMLGMGSLLELHQWSWELEEMRPWLLPQLFFWTPASAVTRFVIRPFSQKGKDVLEAESSFWWMVLLCGAVQVLRSQMPGHDG